MEIKPGTPRELDGWMDLVRQVRDSFPGLETREALEAHRKTVREFMGRRSALCAIEHGRVVGALLFSAEENTLCFLAVEPSFRRRHTAAELVGRALPLMDPSRAVTVTTYRDGDPAGVAARAFYKKLGFTEGKLTEEFGSPVQEFVLKQGNSEGKMYTNNRNEEVILLKKLWTAQPVTCPKCGNAQLELLHKKAKKSDCDWRCPACGEIYRTIRMLKELPSE